MPKSAWLTQFGRILSRETSSGQFVPEIDGLRFVAIFGVLLYHLVGFIMLRHQETFGGDPHVVGPFDVAVKAVADVGDIGVPLFYGISGFILALPFAEAIMSGQPRPSLRRYFVRRLTRLEPPYIINLLIWYPAQIFVKGASAMGLLPHLAASIFYVHNIIYASRSAINQVAWTLEIEVQFYVIAPLLTQIYRVRSTTLRRGVLWIVLVAWPFLMMPISNQQFPRIGMSLLGQLQFFIVGLLLADLYLTTWKKQPTTDKRWNVIGLFAWASLLAVILLHPTLLRPLIGPLILTAYVAAFRGSWWRRFFRWQPVVIIGGMCYTIYLYHWLAYFAFGKLTMRLYRDDWPYFANYFVQLLVLVPLALAACALLFVLIEKPFMNRQWVDWVLKFGESRRRVTINNQQIQNSPNQIESN